MQLEYRIQEEDFLAYQLFTSSQSKKIIKKKKNGRLFSTLSFGILGLIFHYEEKMGLAIYFAVCSVVAALLFPKYFNWRYKKHYQSHIRETYSNRFNALTTIAFTEKKIITKDKIGEGSLNITEVIQVNETRDHFFILMSSNHSLIIPKKDPSISIEEIRNYFLEIELKVVDHLNWNWD